MPSNPLFPFNFAYKGLTDLTSELIHIFSDKKSIPKTMIEIGSYMGESTMIFASSGIFETIHSIEPHQGIEIFSEQYQYTWKDIEKEYKINTRHFNNIIHHKDFSYNVLDKFEDNSIDFIYIDADHTYESVKKDIESYLPKLKDGGDMGNNWEGGFFCPCHGSKFDLAGRVYKGSPAPTNLVIPPYRYSDDKTIVIGESEPEKG